MRRAYKSLTKSESLVKFYVIRLINKESIRES